MFFHQSRRMRLCTGDIRVLFIRRIVVDLYFLAFYLEAWREKAGIDPIAIIDAPDYLEVIKKSVPATLSICLLTTALVTLEQAADCGVVISASSDLEQPKVRMRATNRRFFMQQILKLSKYKRN